MATYDGRCETHRRKPWANTSRRNQVLNPTTWTTVARLYLSTHPACRACGSTESLQVDHITEIADNGAPYEDANLQTLCDTCHIRKTREAKKLRRELRAQNAEQ